MANLLPNYLMRQWTPDGKPLSGGRMHFYSSGTNTPKTTYQEAGETTPHTNPVILDASGHADIWLGDGAYRVHVFDQFGVQVAPPIDGVNGEAGAGSNPGVYFDTYADLRAVAAYPQTAYVHGMSAPGDGGQGWFERLPITTPDDNGVILTAGSGTVAYRRVFEAMIDPRWYGVKYGVAIDQTTAHNSAMAGSARHNVPMQVAGSIRLDQNAVAPVGASIIAERDGFYTSTLNVSFDFPTGSAFRAAGRTFGVGVSPTFAAGVAPAIPLSWLADNSEDTRMLKWVASTTTSGIRLVLDESPTLGDTSITIAQEFYAEPGCMFNVPSAASFAIEIPLICNGYQRTPIFWVNPNITNVTADFGTNFAYPEWFGAAADGTTDDSVALIRAFRSGRCTLSPGYSYFMGTSVGSWPASMDLTGAGSLRIGGSLTVASPVLGLTDVSITLDTPHTWFAGTLLVAQHASFPKTFTATSKLVDGCSYTDDTRNPSYAGTPGPALYDPHLPNTTSATVLGTNAQGKIVGTNDLVLNSIDATTTILHRSTPATALYYNGETIPDTAPWLVFVNNSAGTVAVTLHGYVAGKATHHRIVGVGGYFITVNGSFFDGSTSWLINGPAGGNVWMDVFIDAGGKWFVMCPGA